MGQQWNSTFSEQPNADRTTIMHEFQDGDDLYVLFLDVTCDGEVTLSSLIHKDEFGNPTDGTSNFQSIMFSGGFIDFIKEGYVHREYVSYERAVAKMLFNGDLDERLIGMGFLDYSTKISQISSLIVLTSRQMNISYEDLLEEIMTDPFDLLRRCKNRNAFREAGIINDMNKLENFFQNTVPEKNPREPYKRDAFKSRVDSYASYVLSEWCRAHWSVFDHDVNELQAPGSFRPFQLTVGAHLKYVKREWNDVMIASFGINIEVRANLNQQFPTYIILDNTITQGRVLLELIKSEETGEFLAQSGNIRARAVAFHGNGSKAFQLELTVNNVKYMMIANRRLSAGGGKMLVDLQVVDPEQYPYSEPARQVRLFDEA